MTAVVHDLGQILYNLLNIYSYEELSFVVLFKFFKSPISPIVLEILLPTVSCYRNLSGSNIIASLILLQFRLENAIPIIYILWHSHDDDCGCEWKTI